MQLQDVTVFRLNAVDLHGVAVLGHQLRLLTSAVAVDTRKPSTAQ